MPIKTSLNSSSNKFKQGSLPPHQGSMQQRIASRSLILSNQTLNQPLNPNAFLPGALKCFSKSRSQMANVQNLRRYPQLSNESLRRQAATFMAAPSPQILAEMREEGFPKDFQVENCRSSSEYLHCLLGFGLHQTLNFPVMGVFYLELVRLIMKHLDRFSSNEKVKLIQVSNVCEDILRQNSTRDDFLPVEVMDKIIDEAVKEEHKIQKMIEDFHGEQILEQSLSNENNVNANTDISFHTAQVANDVNLKLNMFSNISVSLASESTSAKETTTEKTAKRKRCTKPNDSSFIIDIDAIEDYSPKDSSCQERNYKTTDRNHLKNCVECDLIEPNINPKNLSGITISTISVSNNENFEKDSQSNINISQLASTKAKNSTEKSSIPQSVEKERTTCHLCQAPSSKERMVAGKFVNAGRESMCPALRSLILAHQLVSRPTLYLLRDHGLNYKTNEIVFNCFE